MFSFTGHKIITIAGVLGALMLSACAPSLNTQTAAYSSANTSVTTTSNSAVCSGTSGTGFVYNETLDGLSYSTEAFQTRVGDFVSATLSASDLGTIAGAKSTSDTHISLTGKFVFDTAGNFVPASSNVDMEINDSLVGQVESGETITAYPVTFTAGTSGKLDRTAKTFTVIFQDSYGTVTFSGKYDGTQVTGRVDFANTSSVDSTGAKSGVLGAFVMSNCGLSQ